MAPQTITLLVLGLLFSLTSAWPVFRSPINLVKREPQSYSVVAVDGGSSSTAPAPATKTVTDAVTQVQTSVILSTIIATQADLPPATTVIPQTVTYATTIATTIIETQNAAAPATVTVEPSITLAPFDNGQWHTTYYFRSTMTPAADANAVAVTDSESPAAPTPTAEADPGQWAAWSGQNNGQYKGE